MTILNHISKSYRSLLIHRLRTLLSTLGILFGVSAIITMLSIGEGAKQETLEQIEQLGMNSLLIRQHLSIDQKNSTQSPLNGLTIEDVNILRDNIPSQIHIAPVKTIKASLSGDLQKTSPEILGVTRHYGEIKHLEMIEGRFLCDLDVQQKRLVCVLGHDIAKELGKEGHVSQVLKIENTYYQIVGILKPIKWKASKNSAIAIRNIDKVIFIPLTSDQSLSDSNRSTGKEFLSEINLQMSDTHEPKTTYRLVKDILKKSHGGIENFQLVIPQELIDQAYRTQRTFNWVLGGIAGISLLVGGIGIMNIMLATVSERTKEIGIRRAVGASHQHILKQFLLETLILTLIGAILGVIAGILLSFLINFIAGWKTIVTFWSIVFSIVMASIIGVCSGLYPANQAAKMDAIRALRHE